MFEHVDFAVADFARSRAFYERVLAPLGYAPVVNIARTDGDGYQGTGFGPPAQPMFWIGRGAAMQGRLHLAFAAPTRAAVDAFHAAALADGATDKGAPGLRPHYYPDYYAAFVLDPDGHTIEAVCRTPS